MSGRLLFYSAIAFLALIVVWPVVTETRAQFAHIVEGLQ